MNLKTPTRLIPTLLALSMAPAAHAVVENNGDFGKLSLGGDVELNLNAANTSPGTLMGQSHQQDRWDMDGRVLLNFTAIKELASGAYGQVVVQPTVSVNAGASADDAWLGFGKRDGWGMKVGRFEAYDMFPLGQDIFVEHSGDSANDLYSDGHGYIYMLKEGRGRAGKGGQVLVNQQVGNWYLELSTLIGDRTNLFANQQYHGYQVTKDKDSLIARPVVAWKNDNFKLALGAESNLISDAMLANGESISKRNGYGLTSTWSQDNLTLNANVAQMLAVDETDTTAGVNLVWQQLGLGYIYAVNKIDSANTATDPELVDLVGTHKIHTTYASYKIPSVLELQNFDIYLGAYWSQLQPDSETVSNMDRYGGRVRFKYFF
jgi:hypothetical protein